MSDAPQSFENHARFVTAYHKVATPLLLLPTLYFGFLAATDFSLERLAVLLFSVGIVIIAFFARFFPLGVQDRLIRLEERIRLERLLPADLRGRIPDLTTNQLVGIRFASDEEVADLVRKVLDQKITDRTEVKRSIRKWRADHQRI